jgi:hypothetical protein
MCLFPDRLGDALYLVILKAQVYRRIVMFIDVAAVLLLEG